MKNITTKTILSIISITTSATAIAQPWQELDRSTMTLNSRKLDIEGLINSSRTNINDDAGVIETRLSASEVATSPFTKITQSKPVVMGIYDGANDMGTIQIMSMKRHADGSATLVQRIFTPADFDPKSRGGELTDAEYDIIKNQFGGNPFEDHKSPDREYEKQFIAITPTGLQTAMGLAMKQSGALFGYFAYLEPQVRTWTTTSGNAFRKKVTYHVQAHYKPHWQVLAPIDSTVYDVTNSPFYTANGRLVYSGVRILNVDDETSNFLSERVEMYYAKKSKSGWTGLTMAIVAVGIGFATGGAGMLPYMTAQGGAIAGAVVVGGLSAYKGTLDEAVTSSTLNVTSVSSKKSLEFESDWTMKWKNKMRESTKDAALNAPGVIGDEFRKEKEDWQRLLSD